MDVREKRIKFNSNGSCQGPRTQHNDYRKEKEYIHFGELRINEW
jgi:hypothetical protein